MQRSSLRGDVAAGALRGHPWGGEVRSAIYGQAPVTAKSAGGVMAKVVEEFAQIDVNLAVALP